MGSLHVETVRDDCAFVIARNHASSVTTKQSQAKQRTLKLSHFVLPNYESRLDAQKLAQGRRITNHGLYQTSSFKLSNFQFEIDSLSDVVYHVPAGGPQP